MPVFYFLKGYIMKISKQGIEFIKKLEGCIKINGKHIIYDDATGQPVLNIMNLPKGATIGYGHLIKSGESFEKGLSDAQATDLLINDINDTEKVINNLIKVQLLQNQYDAIVSFVYNIGAKNFKNSTVLKYLNNNSYKSKIYNSVEVAWKAWNKYNGNISEGLTRRRNLEWLLFCYAKY